MKLFNAFVIAAALGLAAQAGASTIDSSSYSLTSLTGTFALGRTDWNAVGEFGSLNNTTQLAQVQTLLSDGYTPMTSSQTGYNGLYSGYPSNANTIEFAFNGGADYLLNSLTFLASRSYSSTTSVVLEYALNGGAWQTAASTTTGALGITTGAANNYLLNFGGVTADAFRLSLNGSQISFHEISVDGTTAVPEPGSVALLGLGLMGALVARRKSKPASQA
ncbi:PEP-CTERM sorting domain-containing protein [Massilia sp. PWRC2]|uniref:PEP-CTERM sorting domain-containing protein n=1 Tax=Massilia sp. PWRC2 TaxID=2804626 RepID=UPI003CEF6B6A